MIKQFESYYFDDEEDDVPFVKLKQRDTVKTFPKIMFARWGWPTSW